MKNRQQTNGPDKKVCIIGAGTSGVIASKILHEKGIAFDTFEKGSGIGGIWRFKNDNDQSTCYRSLHINTSKRMMALSDFPFQDHIAEYPTHHEILSEYERLVDEFGFRDKLHFNTEVTHCHRHEDGTWEITIKRKDGIEETHSYDYLLVANGHHWSPRMAQFSGHFDGIETHAHHYVDVTEPHDLRDKNVVVVGMGNSAMDIACELGRVGQGAKNVFLSQRSGVWIIPKVFGPVPQDKFVRHPMTPPSIWEKLRRTLIPRPIRLWAFDKLIETTIKLTVGTPQRFGLKAPDGPFHRRHPTVSQEIHNRLVHGDIVPKGNIKELMGNKVKFEDDSIEDVDAIIYATGYDIKFPFFEGGFIEAPKNNIPLWQRIFDPRYDNLAFIALVQPVCAMMPIAELQSRVVADHILGDFKLPKRATMEREMHEYDQMMKDSYHTSDSHTIQIDCPEYSFFLRHAWERGKVR